mmetsp:Transcript_4780/g.10398  ORF Transcript_4780/g.10398 Transcript_4780/m.10398 type:complete len:264 (-) Transcript_4780:77-868(-)
MVRHDEARRLETLRLVHEEVAALVISVVGDDESVGGIGVRRRPAERLEQLLRLRSRRGAEVKHAVVRLDVEQPRRHHAHLLLPAQVAQLSLGDEHLVERRDGAQRLLLRQRPLRLALAPPRPLAAQHRARDVKAPAETVGQPCDRHRRRQWLSIDDHALHLGHEVTLDALAKGERLWVLSTSSDAKGDSKWTAERSHKVFPLTLRDKLLSLVKGFKCLTFKNRRWWVLALSILPGAVLPLATHFAQPNFFPTCFFLARLLCAC